MTDRTRLGRTTLLATGLVALLAIGSVGQVVVGHGDHEHSPAPSAAAVTSPFPSAAPSGSPVASPSPLGSLAPGFLEASGIVLSVDSPALGRVDSFVLLTDEGEQLTFDASGLPFDPAFPLSHIAEHQMTSDPVKVSYVVGTERLIVIALADAE